MSSGHGVDFPPNNTTPGLVQSSAFSKISKEMAAVLARRRFDIAGERPFLFDKLNLEDTCMIAHQNAFEYLKDHVDALAAGEQVFGPNQALQKFGSQFHPKIDASSRLPRGRAKSCYANATAYALTHNDLFYSEGYALDPALPLPFQHAWLVDEMGDVVDPTWKDAEQHVYFGIAFKPDFLIEMLKHSENECGLLVNRRLMREHFGSPDLLSAGVLSKSELPIAGSSCLLS
ncbi:hypothetical protein [Roseibium sp. SCP14]|uniref:hypothetical protein n=1 Tax=Roseibium sp. SCP14 TaxID=3141375 RepID=UPI00333B96F5